MYPLSNRHNRYFIRTHGLLHGSGTANCLSGPARPERGLRARHIPSTQYQRLPDQEKN
jgi:hypothetical protein